MIGLTAIALFLVATGLSLLTSAPADAPPAFIRILNQRKYPASILFLLMTLGPAIAILPAAERGRGWLAEVALPDPIVGVVDHTVAIGIGGQVGS